VTDKQKQKFVDN